MTFEQQTQYLRNIIQRTQLLLIAFGGAALVALPFSTDAALMLATAGILGGIACMGLSLLWCFQPGDTETPGPTDDDVTAHVLSECFRTGKPVFASREPGGRVRVLKAADGEDGEDGRDGEAGKDGKAGESIADNYAGVSGRAVTLRFDDIPCDVEATLVSLSASPCTVVMRDVRVQPYAEAAVRERCRDSIARSAEPVTLLLPEPVLLRRFTPTELRPGRESYATTFALLVAYIDEEAYDAVLTALKGEKHDSDSAR